VKAPSSRYWLLLAALLALSPIPARAEDPKPDAVEGFPSTLAASRTVLTVGASGAGGPAAELLATRASRSTFFLIGEEHGVATIADTVRALLPMLRKAGYAHFAIEVDPYMAQVVEERLRAGGTTALADFLREDGHAIAIPFYNWGAEAALAEAFVRTTPPGSQATLWGLDQAFIGAYSALFEQVAKQARDAGARQLATQLANQSRNRLDYLAGTDPALFEPLRARLAATGDAELARQIDDMIVSARIYAPFIDRPGASVYAANLARENLMKRTFLERHRAAGSPKVLFKFGANHMARGLSPTHVPSLGNFVFEYALAQDAEAFNLLVLCGPGTKAGDFQGNPAECDVDVAKAMPEVVAAIDPKSPTLFDLTRWKDAPRQWQHLADDVRALLWAYDALLIVPNGTPAKAL
jgi:hypothetical protein